MSFADASNPSYENESGVAGDLDRPKMPNAAYRKVSDIIDPTDSLPGAAALATGYASVGLDTDGLP